jgi:DNA-binding CsgD family transcriptional regulator
VSAAERESYPDDLVVELTGLLYEVSGDLSHWLTFMERLRRATDCVAAIVRSSDQTTGQGFAPLGIPNNALQIRAYGELYHPAARELFKDNPLFLETGAVATRRMVVDDATFERSRLFKDYFGPQDWYHLINAVFDVSDEVVLSLTLNRSKQAGPFGPAEIDLLRQLIPHMRRSMQLFRQLRQVSDLGQVLVESLDFLPVGVVLAGRQGDVFASNRTAREILAMTADLEMTGGGRLVARPPEQNERLMELIARAIQAEGDDSGPVGTLEISRPDGLEPLGMMIFSAGGSPSARPAPDGYAAIYLSDPSLRIETAEPVLQGLYGLTRAEARLAAQLVRGQTLEQAAADQGVSLNTVRTHLKRIFVKTDTARQADLVSLLLSGVEALRVLDPGRPASESHAH